MVNTFISSVGRRNYLVNWFKQAGSLLGLDATVLAGDGDPYAPGLASADQRAVLQPIGSAGYIDEIEQICAQNDIGLLLSLHDYDIAVISSDGLGRLSLLGVTAAVPPPSTLDIVSDKLRTVEILATANFQLPKTVAASSMPTAETGKQYVIKHRYGSGSSGVFIVDSSYISEAVSMSASNAPTKRGSRPANPDPSLVVVQEMVRGEEYGLDVVCDFAGRFQGVLARRKLRMRAGETDRAITVDPRPFEALGRSIASVLELRGNTDIDVIVTDDGDQNVIDINPRFGGGYPFVHLAGANVPACYLAWATGREIDPLWLQYEAGVVSSKYEAIYRSELP